MNKNFFISLVCFLFLFDSNASFNRKSIPRNAKSIAIEKIREWKNLLYPRSQIGKVAKKLTQSNLEKLNRFKLLEQKAKKERRDQDRQACDYEGILYEPSASDDYEPSYRFSGSSSDASSVRSNHFLSSASDSGNE